MVSSNILLLDEESDENTTNAATANNHQPPPARDDHNNPIVIMNDPILGTDADTLLSHNVPTATSAVPLTIDATRITDTSNTNYNHSENDNSYVPPRPSSAAFSSCEDSDCSSDATCENDDDNITTIERSTKNDDDNSRPDAELLPKSLLMSNDILISHSTPVIVPQMATVPSRPFKSIRPTSTKTSVTPAAGKHVAQASHEDAKPTVRVLLLCQPSSHQFQVCCVLKIKGKHTHT